MSATQPRSLTDEVYSQAPGIPLGEPFDNDLFLRPRQLELIHHGMNVRGGFYLVARTQESLNNRLSDVAQFTDSAERMGSRGLGGEVSGGSFGILVRARNSRGRIVISKRD